MLILHYLIFMKFCRKNASSYMLLVKTLVYKKVVVLSFDLVKTIREANEKLKKQKSEF